MKSTLLFTLIFISAILTAQQSEVYSKARIYYNSAEEFQKLVQSGIAMDHGKHKKGVFFESDFSATEISIAQNLGATVEIIIEDVQQYYIERNQNTKTPTFKNTTCSNSGSGTPAYTNPTNYNHGSMGGFLNYVEVMREIDSMALLYPNLITTRVPIDTFTTHEGRNLFWVRMSDNANINESEPEILYDAVHHAREAISIHQMIYYMWYLLENYATNPQVQAIIDNTELYFVPFVNPDGFLYNESTSPNGGGMWRKNRRVHGDGNFGVDNNRNYDYTDSTLGATWGTVGISTNTNSDVHCGPYAFSEPENNAMRWFVEQHDFKLALNFHSYSNLLLYPFGFQTGLYCPDDATFYAISEEMVAENNFANQPGWALYETSGGSDDWMYGETLNHNKIYSFTPEIGSGAQGFWPIEADIDPLCQGMMHLDLTAAHLVNNYAKATDLQPLMMQNQNGFLYYDIQRLGLNGSGDFTVSISPVSANILSLGSSNTYLGMSLIQTITDSISYSLSPSIVSGDLITYVITVDNGLFTINDTITKTFGTQQTIFSDNANNLTNWVVSQTWGTTNSTFYSPSSSITDSPTGNYSDGVNKTITLSNPIDLTNVISANLSFYAKWAIEAGWDYVQVEVSTDNGATWEPQCGKYTHAGSADQDFNKPLYDGFQSSWVLEEIDLSQYLGQNIKIRFQIVSDGGVTEDGFYFDDFQINVVYGSTGIENLTENGAFLGESYPNPTKNRATINYLLPKNSHAANFVVTNTVGQEIYRTTVYPNNNKIDISTLGWAQGVYYYFIESENKKTTSKKMVVLN
ncbi:MAG: immune inhibitor A [Bacteroidetes bacterium]|nr:immune inhibitor A [Bacteroidota bacterium]